MSQVWIDGNEAVARSAVAVGCRFFAGYPITPATSVFQHLLGLLPPIGGICIQTEDEIAALGACLGAAMAGRRSMTATAGPGISLMSEQISYAVAAEIPVVIVDVQRLGPSTGSATRGADSDVQFLRWGNSGGMPMIVLAPSDVRDCWAMTARAFDLADRFRCPVILASNKEIGMTRVTVGASDLPLHGVPETHAPAPSVRAVIGENRLARFTSSTHGPDGYIATDPAVIARAVATLHRKIHLPDIDGIDAHADLLQGADTVIFAYGTCARTARAALAGSDVRANLVVLKRLWPVPVTLIRRYARHMRRVVVLEMNQGQYIREIERVLRRPVVFAGRMDGELMTVAQVVEAVAA